MKTNTVSSTPRSVGSSTCRKGNLLANILTCLAFIGALLGVAHTAKAQGPTSYTWNGSAEDLQWYTNTNWTPTGIPQSSSDTAIFNTSSGLILTGTTFSTISDLQFNTGAGGFVISTSATGGFGFNGGGITNNSGVLQFISLNAGALTFNNSSSAGAGTSGGVTIANSGGTVTFNDSSTAGNATISNSALGVTNFSGNVFSGAGSSHLSASGTNSAINFSSFATGGTSTITTSNGGKVVFGGSSSPLSADITANNGGSILFTGNSTGGIGSFTAASGGTFDISGHTGGLSVFSVEGSGTIALGANNLSVGGNNGSTGFQGVIQDAGASMGTGGSFTKTGTGTFTLSGANTYTGGTTISAGTLEIGGSAGAIVGNVANSGTLSFHRTGESDITYAGVVSGTGSVQQNGAGTLILTGENTYSGGTTINTGTLQIGDGTTIGSIVGDVTDNASLAFNHSDSVTYGGVISGTGNVKQNGVGTTILTGANTYTGGTTINTGTLQIGNGGSTGSIAGNVTNNATLAFNRTNSLIVAGKICGTGAVQQNGSGTTIFTGANTYSGGTAITAGALQIGNGGTTGSITGNVVNDAALIFNRCNTYTFAGIISGAGTVTQAGSGTTIFTGANTYSGGTTISGGTLQLGSGGTSGSITGDVTNNASLAFNHSDDVTFAGIISGSGNVKQTGSGKTIFTAANTYSGDTTISSGTLQIGADGMTGSIAGDVTNNSHLIFKRSDALAFAGVISGSGDVKQDGAGTTTLGGANTYTGGTHISAGALQIGNGGTTGSIVGDVVNDTSLIFNRSNASTYAGIITGAGAVTKLGAGTTTFTGDNLYTGGTTVSAGTLQLGNGGHTGTISGAVAVSAGATLAFNLDTVATYPSTSVISGMGSVEQKGTGTTIFKATNTYLGGTLISAGTLQIGDDGTEGSIVGNVIDNAALKFKHSDSVVFAGNISGTGTLEQAGSGALILTGDSTHTGGTTISAGSVVIGNNGTTGTLGGNIVDNGILVTNRSDALSVNGNISGTGSVQQNGAGATTLGGANTYTGGTTANAGTLKAGSTTAFGAATGALTASGTSTVDLNANNVTVGQLNGASGSTLTNEGGANATLTTSSNSTSVFAGLVKDGATNSTALAKSGTGALTLTHANTYTGGTTLNAGTLNLGNASAIGTGALTVAGTSMLDNTSGSALTLSTNNAVNLNADLTFTGTNSLDVGTGAWVLGGNRTLTVTNNSLTIGGDISGSGSRLTKSGAGDLYLTGANTYSGGTVISAGMLQVGNGGTTGSLVGNVTNNSVFAFNRTDASSFNGTIGGTGSVLQKGSGVLTIGGSNTYSGGTTIFDGTIKAGSGTALGTGNLDIANTGTFDLNGNNVSLGAISGASGTTITNNSGITNATLTTSSSSNTTFNGIIQDGMSNSTALAKSGTGALTLTHANTYSGGTTLNAGTLNLANASAIGTGALTVAGTSTIDNTIGTALTLSTNNALNLNADLTFTGTNDLNIGTGAVTLLGSRSLTVSANTLTVGGAVGGVGALTKAGAGTLILVNDNTYNGATTVSAGTLQLGAGGTTGAVTGNITDNAALIFDRSNTNTYNGVISGTGTVEKRSAGLLLLGGDNTYTGGTTITGGTVRVGNGATSGSITG
ncbi:MAG: autotransporter-associated beta strand repeat-containing protein, partial [Chthoniobacterales bacterium]